MSDAVYSVVGVSQPGGEAQLNVFGASLAIDAGAQRDLVRPGPAELLCGALAACVLKNVERFSTTLPFAYRAARVTVQAERQDSPPRFTRFTYSLELVTDEPPRRLALLQRNIEKFGTVSGTLGLAAEVVGELVAVEALDV
ncbi:OsmC family protein [Myxococcota bacterium]|nr:OsmC family protein [Myxococcota bacterium]